VGADARSILVGLGVDEEDVHRVDDRVYAGETSSDITQARETQEYAANDVGKNIRA